MTTDAHGITRDTTFVHDPTCEASPMMHALVDLGCLIHSTVIVAAPKERTSNDH
jgi:hypothetical protein